MLSLPPPKTRAGQVEQATKHSPPTLLIPAHWKTNHMTAQVASRRINCKLRLRWNACSDVVGAVVRRPRSHPRLRRAVRC